VITKSYCTIIFLKHVQLCILKCVLIGLAIFKMTFKERNWYLDQENPGSAWLVFRISPSPNYIGDTLDAIVTILFANLIFLLPRMSTTNKYSASITALHLKWVGGVLCHKMPGDVVSAWHGVGNDGEV
jgi:hypothetical protein